MKKIKVENILSNNGNKIPNQFIITDYKNNCEIFQSYKKYRAGGGKMKKGYAIGGAMKKKGMKKGGKTMKMRGGGLATRGTNFTIR